VTARTRHGEMTSEGKHGMDQQRLAKGIANSAD
jgi:hypothetical protein